MSETVVYTVAREGAPATPVGDGWHASAGNVHSALRAAVEVACELHRTTRGEHHVVREERVRNEGSLPSTRTVFSTRTGG